MCDTPNAKFGWLTGVLAKPEVGAKHCTCIFVGWGNCCDGVGWKSGEGNIGLGKTEDEDDDDEGCCTKLAECCWARNGLLDVF